MDQEGSTASSQATNPRTVHYAHVRGRIIARGLMLDKWDAIVGGDTDTPRGLGSVTRKGWTEDKDGLWEYREIIGALAECPECGKEIECLADTDQWTETMEGSRIWRHDGYGPDMGECSGCDLLIADTSPDGTMGVFDTSQGDAS